MNLRTPIGTLICVILGCVSGLICAAIADASMAEFAIMSLAWILVIDRIGTEDEK